MQGHTQAYLIMLDTDMSNPIVVKHFKNSGYSYSPTYEAMTVLPTGNILIRFSDRFVEVDTNGNVINEMIYTGESQMR